MGEGVDRWGVGIDVYIISGMSRDIGTGSHVERRDLEYTGFIMEILYITCTYISISRELQYDDARDVSSAVLSCSPCQP